MMKFYGYKIRVSCANWEQVELLGRFWDEVAMMVGYDNIVGLGMEWSEDHFTYAIGVFNEQVVREVSEETLRTAGFDVSYTEVGLPEKSEWTVFEGKEDDLQKIYIEKVDCMNRKYDYELEFIDGRGNLKLMIHYIDEDAERYKLFLKKMPEDEKFQRVHAVLVTTDERVLLRYKNGEARITGGRIDPGDVDLEAALRREVSEEINCEIDRIEYLGYLEAEIKKDDELVKENWARMVARVSKILPPEADPDREGNWIYGRTLAPVEIAKEELEKSAPMGNTDKLVDYALKIAREKEYFTELPSREYEVLNAESHD